jgi:hypothetical protein
MPFLCQVSHQYFADRTLTDSRCLRIVAPRLLAFRPTSASPAISLLTVERFRIKSAAVKSDGIGLSSVLTELSRRQLPAGGWAALRSSVQASLESTCLATLAIGSEDSDEARLAQEFLVRVQNPNGSWPAFFGDDQDGVWVTSLAAIALRDGATAISARLSGIHWLMKCKGKESSWFWRWKFLTADRHVRFDPDKFGWPWIPDTVSWVVPTAFAILALRQLPCSCGDLEEIPIRVDRGIEMLMDRVCPGGGWNAGNGVVYGTTLAPHPDDTAVALLALNNRTQHPVVQASLTWLECTAQTLTAPWSLAWTILALAAHGRAVGPLITTLMALPDLAGNDDTSTLALVCLAVDYLRALAALGPKP